MSKNITKRMIAGVLAVLCAAGVVTADTSAGGIITETAVVSAADFGDFECAFKVSDDTAIIMKYNGSGGDVIIPSEVNGKKVTAINERAFYNCYNITSVTIPDGVTEIGRYAFGGCSELKSIELPDSIRVIGEKAFYSCYMLESAVIPEGVKSVKSVFEYCNRMKNVTLPDSVTDITGAFNGCECLKSVNFPEGIKSIGDYTFAQCRALENVTIPDSVTEIGELAFYDCTSLKSIKLPDSFVSIGIGAFACCEGLEDVTIPNSVKNIGYNAFNHCTNLKEISIPAGVTEIGACAFSECDILNEIKVDRDNEYFCSSAGVLYNRDMTAVLACPCARENYIFPASVTVIGPGAFSGCASMVSIKIPDTVTEIGDEAFRRCHSLESITIPDTVTSIGEYAFYECDSLPGVKIPGSVKSISDSAFDNCSGLKTVIIGEGVESIGEAFSCCENLCMVVIPASVKKIEYYAFNYCPALSEISYSGKKSQWEELISESGIDYLSDVKIYFLHKITANPTVTFEPGNGAVKLKWNKADGAEKYGIAGFVDGKWKLIDVGPAAASSYVLKNLNAGTNYKVAVVAMFDGEWNMDFANAITVTPNAAQYPVVKSQVKCSQFRLGWTAVDNAQGYAVAVYQNGWKLLKATSADTFIYTSAKLEPGTYHVAVAAKINGKWDTSNIKSRAVTITIE